MTLMSSNSSTEKRLAKARAHPVRAELLAILEHKAASPKDLAGEVGAPLGVVAYHVRVLHSLKLIRLIGLRGRRGAVEHRYVAVPRPNDARS
jgi:predicted transcriptional regulator